MTGRPSDFSQGLADAICERIADGESLRTICSAVDMPNNATVFRWLAANRDFSDQYARAREDQAESLADEIVKIADEAEDANVARLRVEARKWVASKLKPKRYGEKLELEHSGSIATLTDEQLDARISQLIGKAGTGEPAGGAGETG